MRTLIAAGSAVALLAVAGAASAQSAQVDINASVASKCGISAQASSITIGDLTNANALVRTAVTQEIATALNGAQIIPFCNAPNSQVNVTRAVLSHSSASGNGLGVNGFAQHVRYNLDASLNGLFLDSTSTAGGSSVAVPFGGHNSASSSATHLQFVPATSNGPAVASANGSSATSVDWGSNTDRRLLAGAYTGYVNVTLTPGA